MGRTLTVPPSRLVIQRTPCYAARTNKSTDRAPLSLIAELKRRNVFKVGAAYLALGWVVTQVTGAVVPALNLPASINAMVVWLGIAAFPFVLAFSWIYEMTPEGLKRESEIDRGSSITSQTGRKLDYLIIGLLVAAMAMFAVDRFAPRANVGEEKSRA